MDYTKKPVTIQAIEWTGDNADEVIDFTDGAAKKKGKGLIVQTLEGDHKASKGDMIIRGVHGEYYPCKPDIFAETYDVGATEPHASTDLVVVGNGDAFQLLCKASSQAEGWMKSTKAMPVAGGAIVQVTTQQRNPDGSYAVAEALTYVPGAKIVDDVNSGRKIAGGRA